MVDTQPGTGNNSLPSGRKADVVIDHHPPRTDLGAIPWLDIRTEMGATATIVYGYLEEQQIPIDATLATAFLYALKSETRDLGRESGPDEREAYVELSKVADFERLYAIVNPKLGREHFVALDRALRAAVVWGELLAINLGTLDYPDLVAEVADLMLPYEKAHWVLCVGQHNRTAYLSVRTDINDATAGALIRRVVGSSGAAGGHGMIAGGRMFAEVRDDAGLKTVYDELVARLVARAEDLRLPLAAAVTTERHRVSCLRNRRPHAHLPRVAQTVLAGRATTTRFRPLPEPAAELAPRSRCARALFARLEPFSGRPIASDAYPTRAESADSEERSDVSTERSHRA